MIVGMCKLCTCQEFLFVNKKNAAFLPMLYLSFSSVHIENLSAVSVFYTASDYLCSIKLKKVVTMGKVQIVTNGIWALIDKPRTAEVMAKLFADKVQRICRNNGVIGLTIRSSIDS